MTSFAFFVLLVILTFLTLFSRLGYLSLVRASAVVSDSMEPSIRRFDLVVYTNTNYIVGDVIVYCVTLSHRVVHRIVGFLSLDTVGGNMVMIVIKGDNVNETDSPVDVRVVKGRVVLIVPRELWIPLAFILVIYSLLGLVRSSVVGISYAIVVAIMLASIAAVYATVSQPLAMAPAKVLTMNLAGVYLDPNTYNVSIRYTGELSITSVSVRVNSTLVSNVSASEREVVFKPYLDLLGGPSSKECLCM